MKQKETKRKRIQRLAALLLLAMGMASCVGCDDPDLGDYKPGNPDEGSQVLNEESSEDDGFIIDFDFRIELDPIRQRTVRDTVFLLDFSVCFA